MAKSKRSRSSLSYKLIDRALAPRIHRYISAEEGKELSIDQGAGSTRERRTLVLDIDAMIEDLRHRHPEYKRKTMAAFRSQVLRVCELPEIKQRMLNNYKKKEDDGHEESKQEVPQPSSECTYATSSSSLSSSSSPSSSLPALVSSRFSSDATITEAPTTMTASSGDVEIASNGVGGSNKSSSSSNVIMWIDRKGINPTSNSSSSTGSKKRKNSTAILGIGDGGTSSSIIADVVRSGQQQQKNTRRKTSSFSSKQHSSSSSDLLAAASALSSSSSSSSSSGISGLVNRGGVLRVGGGRGGGGHANAKLRRMYAAAALTDSKKEGKDASLNTQLRSSSSSSSSSSLEQSVAAATNSSFSSSSSVAAGWIGKKGEVKDGRLQIIGNTHHHHHQQQQQSAKKNISNEKKVPPPPPPPPPPPAVSSTYNYTTRKKKKKRNNPKVGAFAAAAAARGDNEESGSSSSWVPEITRPTVRYGDVGGIEAILQDLRELVEYPLIHPEIYQHLGVQPPRGVLLHGPPGCGKTLLANAIAGELGVPFLKIAATEIVSGISGDSEKKLRVFFKEAQRIAPCLIFLDEIDAIAPKRETAQREMSRRIVAQLLTCMDSLSTPAAFIKKEDGDDDDDDDDGKSSSQHKTQNKIDGHDDEGNIIITEHKISMKTATTTTLRPVIVVAATNRPDSLDSALRRAGRFDREITIGMPDAQSRSKILRVVCKGMRLAGDFDFNRIAKLTHGFVGADLSALAKEAAVLAVNRIFSGLRGVDNSTTTVIKTAETKDLVTTTMKSITDARKNDLPLNEAGDIRQGELNKFSADSKRGEGQEDAVKPMETSPQLLSASSCTENNNIMQNGKQSVNNQNVVNSENISSSSLLSHREKASAWLARDRTPLTSEQLAPLSVTMDDFTQAVKKVQPSSRREGFATVPNVTWADVGALWKLREELRMAILEPIKYPEIFESVGLEAPCGVLLYGPPGCGKTLVAKAVASESGASFLSVKGPELLNKYVGASEKAVRQVFSRARASAPCVIFFDELDALCPKRGQGNEGSQVSERVVNQLLTEMDGLDARKQIFVIAATNRPDIIDPAMMRPGRLDKLLYVPLPSPDARYSILKVATKKTPLAANVDLFEISRRAQLNGFSGADLTALVREATTNSLRRVSNRLQEISGKISAKRMKTTGIYVDKADFTEALKRVFPSVSEETDLKYKRLQLSLRSSRRRITK